MPPPLGDLDKVVTDSSTVMKWLIEEDHTEEARRILEGYQAGRLVLLAPAILYAEVGNIVWKKVVFQNLPQDEARLVLQTLSLLSFRITPSPILLKEACELAIRYRRTVYDSLYLALSLRENCPFVTADQRLVNALESTFPHIVWVADWT